jgi:hypothetical protein
MNKDNWLLIGIALFLGAGIVVYLYLTEGKKTITTPSPPLPPSSILPSTSTQSIYEPEPPAPEPSYLSISNPIIDISSGSTATLYIDAYDQYGHRITNIGKLQSEIEYHIAIDDNKYVKLQGDTNLYLKDFGIRTVYALQNPVHFDTIALVPLIGWGRGAIPETHNINFTVSLVKNPNIFARGVITIMGSPDPKWTTPTALSFG